MKPRLLLILALSLPILALGAWLITQRAQPGASSIASGTMPGTGQANIGGTFTLTADDGSTVTEQSLLGKHHLLFFGFADCPDVCPGMLQMVAGIRQTLPEATRNAVQMVFISVDPERDNLAKLGAYVRGFDASFVGWTGTPEQLKAMSQAYLVYFAKKPIPGGAEGDYTVDHSGYLYLMGPDGKYLKHFTSHDSATAISEALVSLVK
jgi:protein SCO1/2